MSGFVADYNEIARRESGAVFAEVPWRNRLERRLKAIKGVLPQILSESELQLSDAYDRLRGLALLSVGALMVVTCRFCSTVDREL